MRNRTTQRVGPAEQPNGRYVETLRLIYVKRSAPISTRPRVPARAPLASAFWSRGPRSSTTGDGPPVGAASLVACAKTDDRPVRGTGIRSCSAARRDSGDRDISIRRVPSRGHWRQPFGRGGSRRQQAATLPSRMRNRTAPEGSVRGVASAGGTSETGSAHSARQVLSPRARRFGPPRDHARVSTDQKLPRYVEMHRHRPPLSSH